jgi:ArsR family transcriptional regulator, arsenate/arsenite/antimonite-responsive transcriptional repressor
MTDDPLQPGNVTAGTASGVAPFSTYAKLLTRVSIASAYRALGDPTRREILRLLRDGDLPAGTLAGQFEISWPSVSRHLKVLEGAGLVTSVRRGGNIVYSLQTSVLEDIATEVADMARIGRAARTVPAQGRARPRRQPQHT